MLCIGIIPYFQCAVHKVSIICYSLVGSTPRIWTQVLLLNLSTYPPRTKSENGDSRHVSLRKASCAPNVARTIYSQGFPSVSHQSLIPSEGNLFVYCKTQENQHNLMNYNTWPFFKKIAIWVQVRYKKQLQKFPGIRWYNLQELPLWMNKCTLTSYVAVGMRSEGNFPKNGETVVGFCFSTMLQHTGRFWSRIS
jgi:hypothetical protein